MGEPRPQSLDTQVQDEASLSESRTLSRQSRLPSLTLPGYVFQQCLGDGAFGSVWLANEENTGRLVAVKIYSHQGRLDWTLLTREVEKLAALVPPPQLNLIRYHGVLAPSARDRENTVPRTEDHTEPAMDRRPNTRYVP